MRSANAGTDNTAGRPSCPARARVNSRFVTGHGAVVSTAPASSWASRANSNAPTASARLIQLIHCRPVPSLPPRPTRNAGSIFDKAPGPFPNTTPKRECTTRMPASFAGCAAASHAQQSSARNPDPLADDSSSISSPRSPKIPTAEATIRVSGGRRNPARTVASARVESTRLASNSRLYSLVQRCPAMLAPER